MNQTLPALQHGRVGTHLGYRPGRVVRERARAMTVGLPFPNTPHRTPERKPPLPLDLLVTSPPYARDGDLHSAPVDLLSRWLAAVAPLLDALRPTHVVIVHRGMLLALPHRLQAILAGRMSGADDDAPYPEVFVIGTGAAYADVVHETAASARSFRLPEAFAAMHLDYRSDLLLDPFAGSGSFYRCLLGTAAAKLGRCVIEGAARAFDISATWVPPLTPVSDNTPDGGQDGLLEIGDRHIWVQITGGEMPDILPHAKWPAAIARQFFIPEGESQMKESQAKRRRKLFDTRAPVRADLLHLAIGKSPPFASTASSVRGVAREKVNEGGEERQTVNTVTVHPLMFADASGDATELPAEPAKPHKRNQGHLLRPVARRDEVLARHRGY